MSRIAVVGDLHGCLDELEALLGLVQPDGGDRVCFLGDLVDRGPSSLGVIRLVRRVLRAHPGSVCLCGNHEEKWLRRRDRGEAPPRWAESATEEDWRFLDGLPLLHRLPEVGVVLVHGGFFPRFFEHYGCLGEASPTWRRDKGKRAARMRRFLRVRQVNHTGDFVSLHDTQSAAGHWAERYDGREGHCYFGHDPQLDPSEPLHAPHATGLDTGCCFGGRLTAAVLDASSGARELVSVPARAAYAPRLLAHEE